MTNYAGRYAELYEQKHDGSSSIFRGTPTTQYFSDEMKNRLFAANFEPLRFFAGFNKQQPIADDTWHIVAVGCKS